MQPKIYKLGPTGLWAGYVLESELTKVTIT